MQQIGFCNMPTLVLIVICGLGPQLLMPLSGMLHTRAIAILVKPFQIKPPQTLWCMVVFTFNPGKFKSLPVQVLLDLRMKLQVLFIVLSVVSWQGYSSLVI